MKFAMLYAAWEGEGWSSPIGFRNELVKRGHEIVHYNLYHRDGVVDYKGQIRKYSNEGINKFHADCRRGDMPDAVFLLDYGQFDAAQFDKKWIPEIVWITEQGDEPQSHQAQTPKALKADLVLSPDHRCVLRYHTMGVNAKFWTHCADQSLFYPRSDIPEMWDCVTTCGPRGGGLTEQIKSVLGDRFNNERYFYGEDHAKRLSMGKMVFQCSQFKEVTRRIFEGAACGKMVITDRLPANTKLSELLVENDDIVYYDNVDDAINKIKFYSENETERKRIALNGYNKVIKEHSVSKRIDDLLIYIEEFKHDKLK